ncbi:hypothetical protein BJ742DRAFT_737652 [Cladochytrium replicatum]|nr:hypothetical protein BJ742DRAFT_737652 [Cladochytrium replicatum]
MGGSCKLLTAPECQDILVDVGMNELRELLFCVSGERVYYDGCAMIFLNVGQGLRSRSRTRARLLKPEEEIKVQGFFLPLCGGIDSCDCLIVYSICRLACEAVESGQAQVLAELHTCYMGTSNSSKETRDRAKELALRNWKRILGLSYHVVLNTDTDVSAVMGIFTFVTGKTHQFKVRGGSATENLALQNVRASFNVTEFCVRPFTGRDPCWYLEVRRSTKHINPIGGIDLREFILHSQSQFKFDFLQKYGFGILEFVSRICSSNHNCRTGADHRKLRADDEVDAGMTYKDLSVYGALRKVSMLGPFGMFSKLVNQWGNTFSPTA